MVAFYFYFTFLAASSHPPLPPSSTTPSPLRRRLTPKDHARRMDLIERKRPHTLFFAGTSGLVNKGFHYSHGVRQNAFMMFKDRER